MANYLVCDRCGRRIDSGEINHRFTLWRIGYIRYILDFDCGPTATIYDLCPKCKKKLDEFMKNTDDSPNLGGEMYG